MEDEIANLDKTKSIFVPFSPAEVVEKSRGNLHGQSEEQSARCSSFRLLSDLIGSLPVRPVWKEEDI